MMINDKREKKTKNKRNMRKGKKIERKDLL
jgi:hypothetical protein